MSTENPQAGHRTAAPELNLLPTVGTPAPERADAARNRRRILDAAARIVAEEGPDAVTMNQVAHASGIGVGTVYRRFGDVSQLLWALLDDRERRFQEAYMSGPPRWARAPRPPSGSTPSSTRSSTGSAHSAPCCSRRTPPRPAPATTAAPTG